MTTAAEAEPIDAVALAAQCEGVMPFAKPDQFYGPVGTMGLGAGIIVSSIPQPIYLREEEAYATGKGAALILTHECDIDPVNTRPFNDKALVVPLIKFDKYVAEAIQGYSIDEVTAFATNVASGKTTRLCFLPRFGDLDSPLYSGALLDLNSLAFCGVQSLAKSPILCSLTGYAIGIIDRSLQNHLFRPKSDNAPLPA